MASLRIIMEQSLEWNYPLYINFIDYEKAFNSAERETMWKLLRHYGVPEKIISLMRCTYQDMSCRIAYTGQLSKSFEMQIGVRQGCLLSPFFFLLVIDWIMKTTTTGRNNGIQWTLWTQLVTWRSCHTVIASCKTRPLSWTPHQQGEGSRSTGRRPSWWRWTQLPTHQSQLAEGPSGRRSLSSTWEAVDQQGGTDRDVTARIGTARAAFVMLKNIWAYGRIHTFTSNVKSILRMWDMVDNIYDATKDPGILQHLSEAHLQNPMAREDPKWRSMERARQEPVAKQILRRKWGWIGHTLRNPASSTTRQALTWNPQEKRKRGRPRNSWSRDTEAELKQQGTNGSGMAGAALNRVRWQGVVDGLCST